MVYSKADAKKALLRLARAAEGMPLPITKAAKKYWDYSDKEVRVENIPLFCETSLYALLGKDEARSLLGDLRILRDYLGIKAEDADF